MPEVLKPDLCVIGAGPGGLSAATGAAAAGASVVLIERGATGGASLNAGGAASKALVAAAKGAHFCQHAGRFGFKEGRGKIEFLNTHAHVRNVLRSLAPNASRERLGGLGIRFIAGVASFKDRHTVIVGNAYEIAAKTFVIATGATDVPPSIAGLDSVPHYTSETIFDLIHCPKHLIILGGSPHVLELAQAHRRLGAEVTVLTGTQPLAQADPECAAVVLDQLAREGVVIRTGVTILRAERVRPRVRVIIAGEGGAEEEIEGSHLLVMPDRRPDLTELNLAAASVKHNADGISVNKSLRTSNKNVLAIGDALSGGAQSVANATHHAELVVRRAVRRLPVNRAATPIPSLTYTDPELAHVGLDEVAAKAKKRPIRCLRWGFHDNDRARAEDNQQGHVKVITDLRGRILGATIVGPQASEMITLWTLAIAEGLNICAMQRLVTPYPTLAEVSQRAAMGYDTGIKAPSRVERLMSFIRRSR